MKTTINDLKKGQKAVITNFDVSQVPLKLIEMGCMEGHEVTLIQIAPLGDPLYLNIHGSLLAIRRETAKEIEVALEYLSDEK